MRLASSLTFVKPQQLGRALQLLNDLKDNIELVEDPVQRADLEAQVDAQLVKAQIGMLKVVKDPSIRLGFASHCSRRRSKFLLLKH